MNINNDILEFFSDPFAKSSKVIGFSNKNDYYKLIKKIYDKSLVADNCLFISNMLPIPKDRSIIDYLIYETNKFNIYNILNEEIVLHSNEIISYKIKMAICSNWDKLLKSESMNTPYINDNIRKNVLSALIINIYTILQLFDFTKENKPKIVFYGYLNETNSYVLNILNDAEFKVLYINSEKDNEFLSFEPYMFQNVMPIVEIEDLLKEANEIEEIVVEKIETIGKTYKDGYGKYLFDGIKTFRPRQIFHLNNKIVHIDSVIEDLKTYWYEENRMRPAFKVENDIVYTPNFLVKVNGIYNNKYEYKSLIKFLTEKAEYNQYINKVNISKLVEYKSLPSEAYSLVYTIINLKIDEEKLKNHNLYKLSKYSMELQDKIIFKLNEFIYRTGFKLKYYEIEDFVYLIFNIISNNSIIKLLENFDYPFKVPKLIIFDEKTYEPSKMDVIIIEFLNSLGIDIVVISPYGNHYIENNIKSSELSTFSLDIIDENFDMESLKNIKEKKSFWGNLFR